KEETAPGTQAVPWQRPSSFSGGSPASKMQSMSQRYGLGTTSDGGTQTVSSNDALALIEANSITTSYTAFQPNGVSTTGATAFAYFDAVHGIESSFVNGEALSVLDFYTVQPYSVQPQSLDATLTGFFRMNADGTLTFRKDVAGFNVPATASF